MHLFYDKEAKQLNYLDSRYYTNDDITYYPSVTTILNIYPKSTYFYDWLKQVGYNSERIVDDAANQGSRVHDMVESYCNEVEINWADKDGKAMYTLLEWQMFLRFVEFFEKYKPELEVVEGKFISEKLGFAGTVDFIFVIDGVRYLVDTKTSNSLHKSHELQVASYAQIWNEKYPDKKVDKTAILWLKASTRKEAKNKIQGKNWQMKIYDRDYNEAYKVFEHVHAVWKEENPNYYPANKTYPTSINKNNKYYAK